ncbi:response regulator [Marispirochaeta aestuarii]|uniref:Response regulator n=1 Tax=Marispirochaeta aestuarii TaxID=1963862 RepID=A0A1Y1S0H7_9SPIO|nr:response regulator [Marispirochaeta aestuarii]ORC35996.1 response regulator [Marispirochaeta aestuarii]
MKKILIIEESPLFRDYLGRKLAEYDIEVVHGVNGLDGMLKIRSEIPDLIIMDYFLTRKSALEVLQEKLRNPNTKNVPVIMMATKLGSKHIMELAKFGVRKVFTKPLKLDALLNTLSGLLGISVTIDPTPSIIEAHFNEEILFIEVAQGLNTEKIVLLKYKIKELMSLYSVPVPKVLLMLAGIELGDHFREKLDLLFRTVLEEAQENPQLIKVLSSSEKISDFLRNSKDYASIGVTDSLEKAMDDLIGLKPDTFAHDEIARERILSSSAPTGEGQESITMRFEGENSITKAMGALRGNALVAAVDDDMVIRTLISTVFQSAGWTIDQYEDGKAFVDSLGEKNYDLVFLDLMMPNMNGFQVLQELKTRGQEIPVIIFSALSKKETVLKAQEYGVRTYLRKPLKPETLLQKAAEVLGATF